MFVKKGPVRKLALGSLVSQTIIGLSTIVMANLYSPLDFGKYALISTASAIFALLLTLSIENFIVPARSDLEADQIVKYGLISIVRNSILILLILLLFKNIFKHQVREVKLNDFLLALLLGVLIAIYSLILQKILRQQEYKLLAKRGAIQNFTISFLQVILSGHNLKVLGLVLGEAGGRLISICILIPKLRLQKKEKFKEGKLDLWSKKNYWFNFFAVILEISAGGLILYYIAYNFGNDFSGQFALAQKIYGLPIALLAIPISQFILSSTAEKKRHGKKNSKIEFHKLVIKLILIGLFISVTIFLSAKNFLTLFLGDEWNLALETLSWMAPFFLFSFVWNPISVFYYVNDDWKGFFKYALLRFFLGILVLLISRKSGLDYQHSLIAFLTISALIQIHCVMQLSDSLK